MYFWHYAVLIIPWGSAECNNMLKHWLAGADVPESCRHGKHLEDEKEKQ